jgi:hypothetical protein
MSGKPTASDLLETSGGLLTRGHLRELGLERRAIDAIFRALPVVVISGYTRPFVRVSDYLELIERSTYRDDKVRPDPRDTRACTLRDET